MLFTVFWRKPVSASKRLVPVHYIKLIIVPVLWAGALIAGRVVAPVLPPFTTAFVRFVFASLVLLPVLFLQEGRFPRPTARQWAVFVLLSLSGVVFFNFFLFSGLRTVTAGRSAVILAFTPAAVTLAAALFMREKVTGRMVLGIVLAFLGAVYTITEGEPLQAFRRGIARGDFFILGCVVSWAVYSLIGRVAMRSFSALASLAYISALGAVLLLPFALWEGRFELLAEIPAVTWGGLLYLGLGAAGLAHLWYYQGIKRVGNSRAAVFMNFEPAAAILLGVIILQEGAPLPVILGAGMVMAGVVLTTRRTQKEFSEKN
jgi:drug/metabolite transporter (DMT)-like permease